AGFRRRHRGRTRLALSGPGDLRALAAGHGVLDDAPARRRRSLRDRSTPGHTRDSAERTAAAVAVRARHRRARLVWPAPLSARCAARPLREAPPRPRRVMAFSARFQVGTGPAFR